MHWKFELAPFAVCGILLSHQISLSLSPFLSLSHYRVFFFVFVFLFLQRVLFISVLSFQNAIVHWMGLYILVCKSALKWNGSVGFFFMSLQLIECWRIKFFGFFDYLSMSKVTVIKSTALLCLSSSQFNYTECTQLEAHQMILHT